jgi:hypothetical protein
MKRSAPQVLSSIPKRYRPGTPRTGLQGIAGIRG